MCLNSHRRGVSLDSADKGQVPLLTQRDEHWGEGDGGQARELLDTKGEGGDGGDGEAGQSVQGLTDWLTSLSLVAVPGVSVIVLSGQNEIKTDSN